MEVVLDEENYNAQMASQDARKNCLTCARPMEEDFLRVADEDNTAIADVLMKHFWFTEIDLLGATICRICWDQVNHFHQFYILVEEVYQIRVASLIVKSEPLVTDHDSLEAHMPETHAYELAVENPKEESLISFQAEPTLNTVEDIQSGVVQPSDGNDQMTAWKKVCMKDNLIGTHVDFTCRQCGAASTRFNEYMKHVIEAHGMKPAFIVCCGKKFYRKNNLYYHVQVLINPDIFRCKQCRKPFDRLRNLDRHMKEQHATKEEKKFKCERCTRSFALMSSYRSHIMNHDQIYRCTECSKKFSRSNTLLNHFTAVHPGSNPFTCLRCERTFTGFKELHKHERTMHPGEWCNELTNSLQSQTPTKNVDESNPVTSDNKKDVAMQQNENSVLVKEEPVWEICLEESRPKISKCEELDDAHQPQDSTLVVKEEPFLDIGCENETDCVQSGTEKKNQKFQKRAKWYRQQEDDIIRKHVNLSCKQCDVVSENFAQYLRHSVEEHNVELNCIECCGKLYYGKDRLSDHVRVFNNPDVFRCKLCEKNFTYKTGLALHMKRLHLTEKDLTFKCDQCPRSFGVKEQYRRHVNWHAGTSQQKRRKQPPAVAESDRLEGSQPKPELKLQEDSEQQECSSVVKDEPASEVTDENSSECMQASDEEEDPQLADKPEGTPIERKTLEQLQKEDDYIREHVKFICKWCGEDSPSFALYLMHALDAHTNYSAFIECCGKKYYRQDRMYQHVQVVNNPTTYSCEQCRKNFNYEHALTLHMKKVHKFGGDFKCDWCSMTFRWQSHLARHIKIHLVRKGRKPKQRYYCTYCERTFNSIRVLQNHLKAVHTGVSP